jgi:hypothetical protein
MQGCAVVIQYGHRTSCNLQAGVLNMRLVFLFTPSHRLGLTFALAIPAFVYLSGEEDRLVH